MESAFNPPLHLDSASRQRCRCQIFVNRVGCDRLDGTAPASLIDRITGTHDNRRPF